jgi:hypothetical protein
MGPLLGESADSQAKFSKHEGLCGASLSSWQAVGPLRPKQGRRLGLMKLGLEKVFPVELGAVRRSCFGYRIVLFLMKGWTLSRPMDVGLESIYTGFLALPNRVRCKQNLLLLGLKEDCIWKGILEVSGLDNKECRMGGSR